MIVDGEAFYLNSDRSYWLGEVLYVATEDRRTSSRAACNVRLALLQRSGTPGW